MNTLKIAGKFLDQPILVAKFQRAVPSILTAGAAICVTKQVHNTPKNKKKKSLIRTSATMAITVLSALAAPKITNKIFKKTESIPKTIKVIKQQNKELITNFLELNTIEESTKKILEKAKEKPLKFKEIKQLFKTFNNDFSGKRFLNKLIPDPENVTSKEIFSEIGRLSVFGLIPVLGGISGGIIGDKLTDKNWKSKIPNKIKEGSYQYLANIFLCNIGAGGALAIMEKYKIKSKTQRAIGMICGILTTGVIGGSAIANYIGNKIINPCFEKHNNDNRYKNKHLFDERRPEPLDIGLHTDDIATVAVMSGLKWIEPALPILYAISGYRAGIGYRNGNQSNKKN